MDIARDVLQDRIDEIKSYIDLLEKLDLSNKDGRPIVSTEQFHILMANVFVLMYNMVEATIIQSIKRLEEIISQDSECPLCLSDKIKTEWISNFLGTKEQLTPEKRLIKGKAFYEHIVSDDSTSLVFSKGGGGNWDDEEIYRFSEKIGIDLKQIPRAITSKVKSPRENELGCMKFIVKNRNKLAHGEISFSECGRDKDLSRIKEIFNDTSQYLKAVVNLFDVFLVQRQFVSPPENLQYAVESTPR